MKDHVGNVRVVFGDYRIDEYSDANKKNDKIVYSGFTDYYPYGLAMDNRKYQGDSYLFGFQGMEQEPDQNETQYHTLFRQYDAVLGRWWSSDPEQMQFPSFSPYLAMGTNPVNMVDPLGDFQIPAEGTKGLIHTDQAQPDYKEAFPAFVSLLKNISSFVESNPTVMKALKKATGLSEKKIMSDLEFNDGPTVFVEQLYSTLKGLTQSQAKDEFIVQKINIDDLESEAKSTKVDPWRVEGVTATEIAITVIHEYIHTVDNANGLPESEKNPEQFEKEALGEAKGVTEAIYKGIITPVKIESQIEKSE